MDKTAPDWLSEAIRGDLRLDGMLRRGAEAHPDRIALADARGGPGLTYADADRWVDAIATTILAQDPPRGSVVALSLPNRVESVVILLAAWRAGLVAALVPQAWRQHDWLTHLPRLGPVAIVSGETDGETATLLRGFGDRIFPVRHVFALGPQRHPRVTALPLLADAAAERLNAPAPPAETFLTVTMTAPGRRGAPVYHLRRQSHWVAAGLALMLEADLETGATILSPYALTGLAGIGCALIPWLLTGGTLDLHEPDTLAGFASRVDDVKPDCIVVPNAMEEPLLAGWPRGEGPPLVVSVAKDERRTDAVTDRARTRIVDVTMVGELGFAALKRPETAKPAPLPLGPITSPSDDPEGAVLLETRLEGSGLLAVGGPMVPDAVRLPGAASAPPTGLAVSADHFVRTDVRAETADADPGRLVLLGRAADMITLAGIGIDAAALDALCLGESVQAAAAVKVEVHGRSELVAAVVPKADRPFDEAAYLAGIAAKGVAITWLPQLAIAVEMIPRGGQGNVLRDVLADRIARLLRDPPQAARRAS